MKPTNKEYHITSFEHLVNTVTKENIENLTVDFMMWLGVILNVDETLRSGDNLSAAEKTKTRWELLKPTFIWTDDGKNEISKIVCQDPTTGEQTIIEAKVPKNEK